jgi:hypothetical protein
MRAAISSNPESGTTRFQTEAPAQSYLELLQASDFEVKHCTVNPVQMAQAAWVPMGDLLQSASELAFRMEGLRRGYAIAGKILSGKYYDSGKRKHRRKNKSQRGHTK